MATGLTGTTGELEVVSPGVVQMSSSFARNRGQVPSSAPDKIFSQKMKRLWREGEKKLVEKQGQGGSYDE
jgi:hypothetical protein